MSVEFTDDDEGKTVVDDDGDEVGIVSEVRHGQAYVEPDPGITDKVKSKLGWGDIDDDTYPIQYEQVDGVTDDEIRIERV
ncbi:PRC-barrel domain containing protein [Halomicrococcus sp. NG-SE-24]|uniref:PRC-barrel domain containing protein n=1 Tax=Halomicrococcus sp. NG-SE-24 TaxID=3436928 RepID=UPI003D961B38